MNPTHLQGTTNNHWFRVKLKPCRTKNGDVAIAFEHPIQPGNIPGGWMVPKGREEQSWMMKTSKPSMNSTSKAYSMLEVKKHNTAELAWIVVNGHVYDCTSFLKDHPGGEESILVNAGSDSTEEFEAIHSEIAKNMLEDYRIGELVDTDSTGSSDFLLPAVNNNKSNNDNIFSTRESRRTQPALVPGEKIQCKLISKSAITHSTRLFRFSLPSPNQVLGLPVGKHIFLYAVIDGKLCMRKYTPTSANDELGHFDLLIKIYFKDHPRFPNGGLMSQYLDSLPLGSNLEIKGPFGHIEYIGRGTSIDSGEYKFARKLAMVAGGTGIKPIYCVIQAVLRDSEDETVMYLVIANRTEDDILLREELDEWAEKDERLKVWYVVGKALKKKKPRKCSVGMITEEVLREHITKGSSETTAIACGPPSMIQFAVTPNLEKMKYDVKNSLLVF